MSFNDGVDMSKSTYPELVDLKITNQCTKGCSYCYQASTPDGKHASYEDICSVIAALAKMEVFEIAIGGGEPTLHPDFLSILKYASDLGIRPSFSTRNLSWFNKESVRLFKESCGAFAYSIDFANEIEALDRVVEEFDLNHTYGKDWVTLQFVLRPTMTQGDLDAILEKNEKYNFPITLLGFKTMGRAEGLLPNLRCNIDWAKTLDNCGISIDTAVANLYREEIAKAGAAEWSYKIVEGAHSMYIDAVAKKMGPSSYCLDDQYMHYEALFTGCGPEARQRRLDNFISEVFAAF